MTLHLRQAIYLIGQKHLQEARFVNPSHKIGGVIGTNPTNQKRQHPMMAVILMLLIPQHHVIQMQLAAPICLSEPGRMEAAQSGMMGAKVLSLRASLALWTGKLARATHCDRSQLDIENDH